MPVLEMIMVWRRVRRSLRSSSVAEVLPVSRHRLPPMMHDELVQVVRAWWGLEFTPLIETSGTDLHLDTMIYFFWYTDRGEIETLFYD